MGLPNAVDVFTSATTEPMDNLSLRDSERVEAISNYYTRDCFVALKALLATPALAPGASVTKSLLAAFAANIWLAQRGGRAETFANGFTRTDHQHDDRERIWQHLEEESPIGIVIKRISQTE